MGRSGDGLDHECHHRKQTRILKEAGISRKEQAKADYYLAKEFQASHAHPPAFIELYKDTFIKDLSKKRDASMSEFANSILRERLCIVNRDS